jgi:hypothetical protein
MQRENCEEKFKKLRKIKVTKTGKDRIKEE